MLAVPCSPVAANVAKPIGVRKLRTGWSHERLVQDHATMRRRRGRGRRRRDALRDAGGRKRRWGKGRRRPTSIHPASIAAELDGASWTPSGAAFHRAGLGPAGLLPGGPFGGGPNGGGRVGGAQCGTLGSAPGPRVNVTRGLPAFAAAAAALAMACASTYSCGGPLARAGLGLSG